MTGKTRHGEVSSGSTAEAANSQALYDLARELLPQYGDNWNLHSLVTMNRMTMARVLYYNELYQKILNIPGVICEFGVQWGATLALLTNLRALYEPYNISRTLFGFDTFEGFTALDAKDGDKVRQGDYRSRPDYEATLAEILRIQENFSPRPHVTKFELVKGDASATVDGWLERNPHAAIAMAIFDMDVYKPTRDVLEKIRPRLVKGSLLVFDEFSCIHFPGETAAVQEVLGLNSLSLRRSPLQTYCAWTVFGE